MADFRKMYFQLAGKVNDMVSTLITTEKELDESYINADSYDNIIYLSDYLDPNGDHDRSQRKGSCN